MARKLFEFLEPLMSDNFWERTQFEKIGSNGNFFNSLGNLKFKNFFQKQILITFSVIFILLLCDSGVNLPFNKENHLKLKRNQMSNREKQN